MKVNVSSKLDLPSDVAWSLVKRIDTLVYISKGLIGFRSLSGSLSTAWQVNKTETMQILLFGIIPAWPHQIRIVEKSDNDMQLHTNESGGAITKWDHAMSVKPNGDQQCIYTDSIDIEAGILTPLVWLYASAYYRYRHIRWQYLVKKQN